MKNMGFGVFKATEDFYRCSLSGRLQVAVRGDDKVECVDCGTTHRIQEMEEVSNGFEEYRRQLDEELT